MSAKDDAIKLVDEFQKRDKNFAWTHLKTDDVAFDLRQRIYVPNLIDSSIVNLCGPAAFFRNLATDDPIAYAKVVIDLFESGQAILGQLTIKTNTWVLTYDPPTGITGVDWMTLAGLRNSENAILRFDSVSDGASGITMPSGLADWFTKAGYSTVVNETNVFLTKDEDHLDRASTLRTHGHKVCLFINADMLKSAKHTNRSITPNHWVVLDSAVGPGSSARTVSFKVFSWGGIMTVPESGTITMAEVLRNYYGFVAAKK